MSDLTIIYYTANVLKEPTASRIREALTRSAEHLPIISVSQDPVELGENVCVGDIGVLWSNVYRQILIGAEFARTKYIACAEDDMLYPRGHWLLRPSSDDTFMYNLNRWWVEEYDGGHQFRYRNRVVMGTCIVARELIIETLRTRFERYPDIGKTGSRNMHDPQVRAEQSGFGEPGRTEHLLGLPAVKMETQKSRTPILTFNHKGSLGGLRRMNSSDVITTSLPLWGDAKSIWERYNV